MIRQSIHSPGTDPAMTHPHPDQGSFDEDCIDRLLQRVIKQLANTFNRLSRLVAANDASMRLSAILPMGGSVITSSCRLVPCSTRNRNTNNITNMTRVENAGLVGGSTMIEGASVSNGSGKPLCGLVFGRRLSLVWFQTWPKTRPALSWGVYYPDQT
jgi:hypothetical protein